MTTGLQFFVTWWYRKQPMFYLPEGWLGPLTWWLSLPFAPAGSVGVGVWQMACKRVIVVGERIAKDFLGSEAPDRDTPEKVAMPGLAPTPKNTPRKEEKTKDK